MWLVDTWPALAIGLAIGLVIRSNTTTKEEDQTVIVDEPPVQSAPKAGLVKIAAAILVLWLLSRHTRARREAERQL